ncbi:choline-binding transcriptional repressor BetI [Kaistia granuli]|uniref:choline-binding transcriptional repressor BetI n=1 Tax=Kaistia granuli TaxID=363259 RepID=UPI0003612AF2|nr:transcriptional regulator BetI [Kaistia granuli]
MAEAGSVRIEVEDLRRRQLIEATIESLAEVGFAACTLMDIGRRAGASPGLVAHYFGDKEGLLEATLRYMAGRLSRIVSIRLAEARSPRERVQAVIDANLAPEEFDRRTASVWLAFWGQVIHSARFKRVQNVYQRRMLSNLRHGLKQMVPAREAQSTAVAIAAVIDGLWLRETLLAEGEPESAEARAIATAFVDAQLAAIRARTSAADALPGPEGRKVVRNFIGGRARANGDDRRFAMIDPATGETIAEIELADAVEIDAAVASAEAGQRLWGAMTGAARGQILRRASAMLRERSDELARLETLETGRPIRQTAGTASAADCIDYFAGLAGAPTDGAVDLGAEAFGYTRREPLGVLAAIGDESHPLLSACGHAAPALAAGNALILKPSEQTPLSAARLAEILSEAGVPDGVFNVVHGATETERLLARHPGIIRIPSADAGQPRTFEGDGKSSLLVFEDAELDDAVSGALLASFARAGWGGTRIFVQESVRDAFLEKLVARASRLIVGDPLDPRTQIGALISEAHLERLLDQIAQAREAGVCVLAGGYRIVAGAMAKGAFVAPTILDQCTDTMAVVREAIVGPVATVLSFRDEDDGIARANARPFGPTATVFTRDLARGNRVVARLHAGSCWINHPGFGVDIAGEAFAATLEPYTRLKRVFVQLGSVEAPF